VPTRSYTPRLATLLAALVLVSCGEARVRDAGSSAGQASRLRTLSLTRQAGQPDQLVSNAPTVRVTDPNGTPVAGVTIEFEVAAGGGAATPATGESGADGRVQTAWRLGASGAQTMRANLPGTAQSVTFHAELLSAPSYHIELSFLSAATDAQRAAFTSAAARIEEAVVGALPPLDLTGARPCDGIPLSGTVDGLLIFVRLVEIDGPGGVLGQAGPCVLRASSRLPAVGVMEFDTEDLAELEARGRLGNTILHEMLHIVGFGFWDAPLLFGARTAGSAFTGANAVAAAVELDGAPASWTTVPVENCAGLSSSQCGAGTRDAHWRESVFGSELMTGYLSGSAQPLSRTTIASLADLGYTVDLEAADPFDLGLASLLSSDPDPEALPLGDDILRLPLEMVP